MLDLSQTTQLYDNDNKEIIRLKLDNNTIWEQIPNNFTQKNSSYSGIHMKMLSKDIPQQEEYSIYMKYNDIPPNYLSSPHYTGFSIDGYGFMMGYNQNGIVVPRGGYTHKTIPHTSLLHQYHKYSIKNLRIESSTKYCDVYIDDELVFSSTVGMPPYSQYNILLGGSNSSFYNDFDGEWNGFVLFDNVKIIFGNRGGYVSDYLYNIATKDFISYS